MKIKYDIWNERKKEQEPYSGIFENEREAAKWYMRFGRVIEKEKGTRLIRIEWGAANFKED